MSSIKKLLNDSSIYIGSSMLNASIPFVLLPFLTRFLTPDEYGVIAVFNVWTALLFVICSVNIHASSNRKFFDATSNDGVLPTFIFNAVALFLTATIIVLCFIVMFEEQLVKLVGLSINYLLLGLIVAICNVFIQMRLGQWQVRGRPIPFGIFLIAQSLLNMATSLFLVVGLKYGYEGRIIGILSAVVIFALIALYLLWKDRLFKCNYDLNYVKEALAFGGPLIPHMIGAFLLLSIDRVIINSKLGSSEAGLYMVAFQISMVVSIIVDSINKAFSPWLYNLLNSNNHDSNLKIVKVTYCLYGMFLLGMIFVYFSSSYIVNALVGSEFKDAATIVPILCVAQGIRGAYLLVTNYMFYAKKTIAVALITLSVGSFHVALLSILLDAYGLVGAAYSLIVSMCFQWLVTWYIANRVVRMPWTLQAG